ncbi:hypothetical protein RUM43_010581 [Polyplax serrata]|uniref:C2 domain-containing protein 5 n=1 Tax=Polyplax serrata TaxID=468196 RepID=A0AAN8PL18_POLSC
MPLPSRVREKSPRKQRKSPSYVETAGKVGSIVGKRFSHVGKSNEKSNLRNVKIVHRGIPVNAHESRSHSVERGSFPPEIRRGGSTHSLFMSGKGDDKGSKIIRGLKAIGFSHKNKLLRKIPAFKSKFNSDSSTFEASESEVESLSDWSTSQQAKEESARKEGKYQATYSTDSSYELGRVVEVKESTHSPPGSPLPGTKKRFGDDFDRRESSTSGESSSSESSSDDDSSVGSSTKSKLPVVLSSVRRVSCKKTSYTRSSSSPKYWRSDTPASQEELCKERKPEGEGNDPVGKEQEQDVPKNSQLLSETNNYLCPPSLEVVGNLDLACPEISVDSYDQEVSSACPLTPNHRSTNGSVKPQLFKSKSAIALPGCPSHECESTLSSVLIAPDYKEHGPCLIPSSRNDADGATERIPGPVTPNTSIQVAAPQSSTGGSKSSHSPAKVNSVPCIHRRSSDSDLSITPKGNSLTGSDRSYGPKEGHCRQNSLLVRPSMNQDNLDMLEYPFLTMSKYPPGFIQHLGGTVSARSVKLLERITNIEEPETRDAWWMELRMEVRSHARAMGCNVVIGYTENTSICDDVCVLSASGTAALINLNASVSETDIPLPTQHPNRPNIQYPGKEIMTASLDRCDFEKDGKPKSEKSGDAPVAGSVSAVAKPRHPTDGSQDVDVSACSVCHIPYSENSVPFRVNMQKCAICRRGKVPDVLFTTIDLVDNVPTIGKGSFIHAYVCRPKRDCKGEMNAKEISDGLPFLEYELHRLLINKLKVRGMNTIFGLKVQVSIGEKILIGLATGTAVFLSALPPPPVPKITAGNSWKDSKKLGEMQKQLQETVKKSKDFYQIKPYSDSGTHLNGRRLSEDTDDSDDEYADLDLSQGNKDTCILEVDDAEDADVVSLLIDPTPPEGFHAVSTETLHGLEELEIVKNLQMFTQVWRAKIPFGQPLSAFNQHFNRLLQGVYFKLRHMVPCALSDLQFKVILEQDEIQLSLLGMALGLGENDCKKKRTKNRMVPSLSKETIKKIDDSDMIFSLEEDLVAPVKSRNRSPVQTKSSFKHTPPRGRYGVDITPLPYVPGGKIERYLGNLNFFFIRESTCIREGGGLGGFIHSFITEVLAIVRAHVTALGGNAMVAYFMSECFLYHYPHKNQGQCLINVGGDVVYISYYPEE